MRRPLAIENELHVRADWRRTPEQVIRLVAVFLDGEDSDGVCGHDLAEESECPDGGAGCRFTITGDDMAQALFQLADEMRDVTDFVGELSGALRPPTPIVAPALEDSGCGN